MSLSAFPKIFHLGDRHIESIWDEEVEITEKLDGSQFVFGVINGALHIRSKGAYIYEADHFTREIKDSDIFGPAVKQVMALYEDGVLHEGIEYYSETLCKPRHSTLKYDSVPEGHIALFGCINNGEPANYESLLAESYLLGIDVVRLLYKGRAQNGAEQFLPLLDQESQLGGPKIEGFVVKAHKEYFVGGQLMPIMSGKYVSESFKEVHKDNWSKKNTSGGKWNEFVESHRTEARWQKAVHYLRDQGELTGSPKDIGPLIGRISKDITEEEQVRIKDFMWKEFGRQLIKRSTYGFPEWYKKSLLTQEPQEDGDVGC